MRQKLIRICLGVGLLVFPAHGTRSEDEPLPPSESLDLPALRVQYPAEGGEQSVELVVGQDLEIALPGDPTTGYIWEMKGYESQTILTVHEEGACIHYEAESSSGSGFFHFRLHAFEPGEAVLRFVCRRLWEEDAEPLHTAVLNVIVR